MKIIAGLVVIVMLGIAYYAISPLFNVQEINDELPDEIMEEVSSGFEDLTEEQQSEMAKQMEEVNSAEKSAMADVMPQIALQTETSSPVMGTVGHPASGSVRILETAEGTVIRYEDFETINGPQLRLYLAKDLRAEEFIDLGPIRGTRGNINYIVPEGVDISEYRYVMYWCEPFSVLFNYADLLE